MSAQQLHIELEEFQQELAKLKSVSKILTESGKISATSISTAEDLSKQLERLLKKVDNLVEEETNSLQNFRKEHTKTISTEITQVIKNISKEHENIQNKSVLFIERIEELNKKNISDLKQIHQNEINDLRNLRENLNISFDNHISKSSKLIETLSEKLDKEQKQQKLNIDSHSLENKTEIKNLSKDLLEINQNYIANLNDFIENQNQANQKLKNQIVESIKINGEQSLAIFNDFRSSYIYEIQNIQNEINILLKAYNQDLKQEINNNNQVITENKSISLDNKNTINQIEENLKNHISNFELKNKEQNTKTNQMHTFLYILIGTTLLNIIINIIMKFI